MEEKTSDHQAKFEKIYRSMLAKLFFAAIAIFNIVIIVIGFREQLMADEFHIGRIHSPMLLIGSILCFCSLRNKPGSKKAQDVMYVVVISNITFWALAFAGTY